jgi:hypothetical protein
MYKDNGQGSSKNLFSILKIDRRHHHRRLKKTAIFVLKLLKMNFYA